MVSSKYSSAIQQAKVLSESGEITIKPSKTPIGEIALGNSKPINPKATRMAILDVNPESCTLWDYHNRHASKLTESNCSDLIESLKNEIQLEPALARKLPIGSAFSYELIFGARRHFACGFLGIDLKLRVIDCDDVAAAKYMHIENAKRKDLTPIEKAISFKTLNDASVFEFQKDLALAHDASTTTLSRYLAAASLLDHELLDGLIDDPLALNINALFKLNEMMLDPDALLLITAASNGYKKDGYSRTSPQVISGLLNVGASVEDSGLPPIKKKLNITETVTAVITRNAKGKVTIAFDSWDVDKGDVENLFVKVDELLSS
jgi:ParB/RepB/Spo0J family partition protein